MAQQLTTSDPYKKMNRSSLIYSDEYFGIKEALQRRYEAVASYDPQADFWTPIRETPLSVFFDKSEHSLEEGRMNPNLAEIWKNFYGVRIGDYSQGIRETTNIPNDLTNLKISDIIIEGAEPYSDWKLYGRTIDMDAPRVNVPRTRYTFNVGGQATDSIEIFAEGGTGAPPPLGGRMETVALDCSSTNNSYRGSIQIHRNQIKDNNFLAVEQAYKNAGNTIYFLAGKRVIDNLIAGTTTNTADRDALDLATPDQQYLEALIRVIRAEFKGTQRNTADTMFINPSDASEVIRLAHADGGPWPFLDKRILRDDNDSDVVNNSGMAAALGLRNVWETPQITAGTVMITKRDVANVVGIREDLTIENLDQQIGGLFNSELVIRFDVQFADENGAFRITNFTA